jgi:hypothetical protein
MYSIAQSTDIFSFFVGSIEVRGSVTMWRWRALLQVAVGSHCCWEEGISSRTRCGGAFCVTSRKLRVVLPGYLVEEIGSVTRREMAHLPGRGEGLCHQVAEPLVTCTWREQTLLQEGHC